MLVLGLDQSPKGIGWCYGLPGAKPAFGYHQNLDFGDNTARLGRHVREWLITFAKSAGVETIYFEQVLVRKYGLHMPTLYRQMAVVAGIETAAEMIGLEDSCFQIMIADWRTQFHHGMRPPKGQGDESDAWKAMAIKECARRDWYTTDHNIAEACGIWHYGCLVQDKVFRARQRVAKRRAESVADEARQAGAA